MKVITFDIGGTLMEYRNMPNVWVDFYQTSFEYVRTSLKLNISDKDIDNSMEILKSYNPRIKYREVDYPPEVIFTHVTSHWQAKFKLSEVIDAFFASMKLTPYIYPETIDVLERLKADGYKIATLTDVATGMPDKLHKNYFTELLPYFDLYVSSLSCGYRKPNSKGLQDIADHFGVAADDVIFIGDEEKDIVTAKRFGCQSVLINRQKDTKHFDQDYTITTLNKLCEVIQ